MHHRPRTSRSACRARIASGLVPTLEVGGSGRRAGGGGLDGEAARVALTVGGVLMDTEAHGDDGRFDVRRRRGPGREPQPGRRRLHRGDYRPFLLPGAQGYGWALADPALVAAVLVTEAPASVVAATLGLGADGGLDGFTERLRWPGGRLFESDEGAGPVSGRVGAGPADDGSVDDGSEGGGRA